MMSLGKGTIRWNAIIINSSTMPIYNAPPWTLLISLSICFFPTSWLFPLTFDLTHNLCYLIGWKPLFSDIQNYILEVSPKACELDDRKSRISSQIRLEPWLNLTLALVGVGLDSSRGISALFDGSVSRALAHAICFGTKAHKHSVVRLRSTNWKVSLSADHLRSGNARLIA